MERVIEVDELEPGSQELLDDINNDIDKFHATGQCRQGIKRIIPCLHDPVINFDDITKYINTLKIVVRDTKNSDFLLKIIIYLIKVSRQTKALEVKLTQARVGDSVYALFKIINDSLTPLSLCNPQIPFYSIFSDVFMFEKLETMPHFDSSFANTLLRILITKRDSATRNFLYSSLLKRYLGQITIAKYFIGFYGGKDLSCSKKWAWMIEGLLFLATDPLWQDHQADMIGLFLSSVNRSVYYDGFLEPSSKIESTPHHLVAVQSLFDSGADFPREYKVIKYIDEKPVESLYLIDYIDKHRPQLFKETQLLSFFLTRGFLSEKYKDNVFKPEQSMRFQLDESLKLRKKGGKSVGFFPRDIVELAYDYTGVWKNFGTEKAYYDVLAKEQKETETDQQKTIEKAEAALTQREVQGGAPEASQSAASMRAGG